MRLSPQPRLAWHGEAVNPLILVGDSIFSFLDQPQTNGAALDTTVEGLYINSLRCRRDISMPVVQVPNEFFRQERRQLYANWSTAFWRELIQNAADAGSSTISITLEQRDAYITVYFGDDGPGITREVMENVYFRLGATTKGGPANITRLGGFGRARILTCFSMLRYVIRTQNLIVSGEGANYGIEETSEIATGCHLTIDIDDASLKDMLGALRTFLRQSQLGCRVVINGEAWTEWALRGAFVTKLKTEAGEFASVYVLPDGLINHVIVRSKGIQTFFQLSRVPMQVVIEVEPSMLRNVLTGNRDGMLLIFRNALDSFLEEMTVNSSSLRRKRLNDQPVRETTSTFSSTRGVPANQRNLGINPANSDVVPDVFIFDESDDAKITRTMRLYEPANWNDERQQTMLAWKIACQMAVDAMLDITDTTRLDWAVGWYFGDASKFAVTKRKIGLCVFCINPLDANGQHRLQLKDTADQRRLLVLSAHEVTHAIVPGHDEDFATLITEIVAALDQQVYQQVYQQTRMEMLGQQRADPYDWTSETYLLGLKLLRDNQGGLPAVMKAIPTANEGQINRKFGLDAPDESLFGTISVFDDDRPMDYMEFWKIGRTIYPQTWKHSFTKRYGLPRTAIRWDEPTFLTAPDRLSLRREWHEKITSSQINDKGDPLTADEIIRMQTTLWSPDNAVQAMRRFFLTHVQVDIADERMLSRMDQRSYKLIRQRYNRELKMRENDRYNKISRGLALLVKRVSRQRAGYGRMTAETLRAYGNRWFDTLDSHNYLCQLTGYEPSYFKDQYEGHRAIGKEVEEVVMRIANLIGDHDLDDSELETYLRSRTG